MRRRVTPFLSAALAVMAVLASTVPLRAGQSPEATARERAAKPAVPGKLDIIKKLTGEWVEVGPDGKPTTKVISSYHVTAGGSAVEETIFAGQDHEMITLYHMDGDELVLTHYCVMGNQVRMKAEPQTDPRKLVFHCAGGTNMKSESEEHMHHATIVWKDDNHIHSEWQEVKDGRNVMTAAFDLARK
ncbi:MAG TPA: hypothetical protein VFE84_13325 [Patescibacteria group bacterium]|nr:hypothetical protein [Patescibacteria group bacterium]